MTDSPRPIEVLHVDDEPDFAAMAAEFIERHDDRLRVTTETSVEAALETLGETAFDCIVGDYEMPGLNGIEFLERVREDHPNLPFILFTGKGSEDVASEAISAGVSDYLQKGSGTERYSLLANRIGNLVSQNRAERQLERRAEQQERVAELGRQALAGEPMERLFDTAVRTVTAGLGTEYVKVLEYRPDHEDLLLRAGVGWRDGAVGEETVGTGGDSQAGHTLRSEEPIVVEDLRTEDRFRGPALLVDHDVVSGISVIIGRVEDPWGVLGAHTSRARRFADDDVLFVQGIANVLAAAIDRAETERRLRRTRSWYETILAHLSDYVIVIDESAEVSYVTPAIEHVLGYEPAEVIGTSALDYVHPDDQERAAEAFSETIDTPNLEVSVEFRTRTAEGSYRWIEARGRSYLADDEIGGLLVSVRDVSERKERQRELEAVRTSYEALFQASPVPIWIQGVEEIYYANQAAADLHGVDDPEHLVGRSALSFVPDDELERTRERNERILEHDEPVEQVRGTVQLESGGTRDAVFAAAPFRYRGERVIVAFAQEVTEPS